MKKKLISLIVATLAIASLAGCGSADTASDKSPVASESAAKDEADAAGIDANAKDADDKTVEANLDDMFFSPENFEIVMAFVNEYEDDFGTLDETFLNKMGAEIPAELYENKLNPGSYVTRLLINNSPVLCPLELKEVYEIVAGNGSTISYDLANELASGDIQSYTYEELCEALGCEGTPVGFKAGSANCICYAWESEEPNSSSLRRFWVANVDSKTNMVYVLDKSEHVSIGE